MQFKFRWMLLGLLAVAASSNAQDAPATDVDAQVQSIVSSLHWRDGQISVPKAKATFRLGEDFHYLEAPDARKVLEELWGNPPDDSVLGLVVPKSHDLSEDGSWAVVVSYSDDGYVSDSEAAGIDYDEVLADMKDGVKEENEARKEGGFQTVQLNGWATAPRYDAANKKLYWAKDLQFEGEPAHTLNYDIRVLGRSGYLSLNAVADMDSMGEVQGDMQKLLPMVEFDPGARYADFNDSTDKVAAYGIAALVGGGLAAKTGLLAKLGVLLLGLKKLLIPIGLVLVAFGKKIIGFFGRDKGDRNRTVS
jgi:uncharacterized membrane-anchored protein